MKKRLVFYFYLTNDLIDSELYKTHFACLDRYKDIFDEMVFVISVDDVTDTDLIHKFEERLSGLHTRGNIMFDIHKNDEFRENYAFKKYVVDRLDDDVITFFGHGKGVSNLNHYDKNVIFSWILGMYFYSLNFIDEVEECLIDRKFISYGSFLTKNEKDKTNKYSWFYIGTFFWVNNGKLLQYIKNNNIDFPRLNDRFYDEEFLGNIYNCWPERTAASHQNMFLTNAVDFYNYFEDYLNLIYKERDDFRVFINEITGQ